MAKQRPIDFPKWATGGINILPDYTPPLSEGAGYIPEQKPPSIDWNTIWHRNDTWVEYYDENIPHIKDIAGLANSNRHGLTTLTYQTGGGSLTSPATPGGVYWIDGVRVELDTSRLTKLGQLNHDFNPNQDTYISITGSTETTLVFTEVPNGDPAPAPPAGFTNIVVVESDALEVTFVAQLLNETVSTLFPYYFETLCSGERCEFQPVTNADAIAGSFINTGNGDAIYAQANGSGIAVNTFGLGSSPVIRARHIGANAPAAEFIGTLGAYAVEVVGLAGGIECSTLNGTAVDARTSGTGASVEAVNAVAVGSAAGIRSTSVNGIGCEVTTTGNGFAGVFTQSGTGFGLLVQSANSIGINAQSVTSLAINAIGGNGCIDAFAAAGTCLDVESGNGLAINAVGTTGCIVATSGGACITATGSSRGLDATCTGNGGIAVDATATGGLSIGVRADAVLYGVRAFVSAPAGIAVEGRTAANASNSGYAVNGIAENEGVAGNFQSEDGWGVRILTTGSERASLSMEPHPADPSSVGTGDIWFRTTGPKFRLGTDNRQFWGTPAGMQMAQQSDVVATYTVPNAALTVVSKAFNVAAGSSAWIVITADIRFNSGGPFKALVTAKTNALTLKQSYYRIEDDMFFPHVTLGTFSFSAWVHGPFTSVSLSAHYDSGGAGDSYEVFDASLSILGTVKTADIV